tara:strand:+ start:25708 stop:26373 length:666 start_codon:yes stop_codon:yes gene_type:complete
MNSLPIIFLIPFRSGSKGLKNKNINIYKDKPLFRHSTDVALETKLGNVYISTDYGIDELEGLSKDVIFVSRPVELASDEATMSSVVLNFLENNVSSESIVILLQATSPNRTKKHISEAINRFTNNSFDLVMSVTETPNDLLKSGLISGDGNFASVNNIDYCFSNRQNLPKTYKPNGSIYIFKSSWFKINKNFSTSNIGAFIMDNNSSLDIDQIEDLEYENK